jgi:hypothetical protein
MKRSPNELSILFFQAWAPAHLQGKHAYVQFWAPLNAMPR